MTLVACSETSSIPEINSLCEGLETPLVNTDKVNLVEAVLLHKPHEDIEVALAAVTQGYTAGCP